MAWEKPKFDFSRTEWNGNMVYDSNHSFLSRGKIWAVSGLYGLKL